jgi:trk system potassium uptake protein TrkA
VRIAIVGVGRIGAHLAGTLANFHDVTVIDQDPIAFRRLPTGFRGKAVQGNGIDIDVLRDAGVAGADVLLALTNGDNRNVMAAQIAAKSLGVRRAIARIYDPERAKIYNDLGIETVCPTVNGAQRLFRLIASEA